MINNPTLTLQAGSRVCLHYALTLPEGEPLISTHDREPEWLFIGDGFLPAPLERYLLGLRVGDIRSLALEGDQIFGPWQATKRLMVPIAQLSHTARPTVGQRVFFDAPEMGELTGIVITLGDQQVHVDCNHPLSGRPFRWNFEVIALEPPAQK
ncbi:MAG: hypothetical protein WCP34_04680 [Pseudomonadota bacterium]